MVDKEKVRKTLTKGRSIVELLEDIEKDKAASKERKEIEDISRKTRSSFVRFRQLALQVLYFLWVLTFGNFVLAFILFIDYSFLGWFTENSGMVAQKLDTDYLLFSGGFFVINTAAIISFVFGKNNFSSMSTTD